MTLFGELRKINGKSASRLYLEQLEDRLTPAVIDTVTNVAINLTPNLAAQTSTETVTATVTLAGANTAGTLVTNGNVAFNLNGQTGTAALNSNGQAVFTVTLPRLAVETNQILLADYEGATAGVNSFNGSLFLSPVYLNIFNGYLNSNITFTGPPPNQSTLPITQFGTYNGEKDEVTLLTTFDFNYVDPGTVQNFTIFGLNFPGSFANSLFDLFENAVNPHST